MNILIDTSAFIAWFNKNDRYHPEAQRVLDDIKTGRIHLTRFVVTDYIVDETLTFLKRVTRDHDLAVEVGDAILNSSYVHMEQVNQDIFNKSYQRFKANKGLSFTDCTSMETMDHLGVTTVFTFDAHFKQAGYASIP